MSYKSDNLEELERVIPDLITLISEREDDWVEYEVGEGSCRGRNLFNIPEVSIQRATLTQGTKLAEHTHPDSREWLIVFKGNLRIVYRGVTQDTRSGEFVYLEAGVPHWAVAVTDCELIGITVPKDKGYPGGQ
jgi:quercetin dioxygenase-like cupin family protein